MGNSGKPLTRTKLAGFYFAPAELEEIEQLAAADGASRNDWVIRRLNLASTKRIDAAKVEAKAQAQAIIAAATGASPSRPKGKGGRPRKAA